MRITRTNATRYAWALIGLMAVACAGASRARQPLAVQFSLDRPLDAVGGEDVLEQGQRLGV